jgi:hypothetical protein
VRRVKMTFPLAPAPDTPLRLCAAHLVLGPEKAFPTSVRMPRRGNLGW